MRWQRWVVWFGGALGIGTAAVLAGGTDRPAAGQAGPEIVADVADLATAKANRFGEPFDPALWQPGRVVWGFLWDSFVKQSPPPRARYVIQAVDAKTRRVTFDRTADAKLTALKVCDGSPIADAREGAFAVRLEAPADAGTFRP